MDIKVALKIIKESQTQLKELNVSMDNVIQSKTVHAKRKPFASQIALKFQVALYYILLTTKLQIINLNHMLFGLTKQVINLLIYSMLLK